MDLTFLQAPVPLTKRYERDSAGTLSKTSYPHVYQVTTHRERANDLGQLEALLKQHAARGHCLVKGNPTRDLVSESRAGTTDSTAPTDWVCFDVDGLPNAQPETFLAALNLSNVSYVLQYSASHGITDTALRCHIFMQLDKPYPAQLLKQWLKGLNLDVSLLTNELRLTKTGNALLWPLDITACQNDKLIYIAAPKLVNVKDPLGKTPRISLVRKKKDLLTITGVIPSTAKNREREHKELDRLREAEGLPKRRVSYKMHGSLEVMVRPDVCSVTGIRNERGFVYLNLNGGDSWAYYFPEDRPDFIYNFKGEPVYLTKELLPDFWQELTSTATKITSTGLIYLAFCDRNTSTYWRGQYDSTKDELDIRPAKNETQVRHFATQVGLPLGDYIPEWDLCFEPKNPLRVDVANKKVNLFVPSPYFKAGKVRKSAKFPPTIAKIITNVVGGEPELVAHFLNWLAFIAQNLDRSMTAWVLTGREGTGKGLLANHILRPLFGPKYVTMRRVSEFTERFNEFMATTLFTVVDEVQTSSVRDEDMLLANVRNYITEPFITIRAMHSAGVERPNHQNFLFFSNSHVPVTLPKNDRRHNVGKYQANKLVLTDEEIDVKIPAELQEFCDYLLSYKVDAVAARTPLDNAAREELISVSEASVDVVIRALQTGQFGFFVDALPTSSLHKQNALELSRVTPYETVLRALHARTDLKTGACNISRDELWALLDYCIGNVPRSPHKFTAYLKHHNVHISKVWIGGAEGSANGTKTTWTDIAQWPQYQKLQTLLGVTPPAPAPLGRPPSKTARVVPLLTRKKRTA